MCGGTLEIATCSHVGHVFRKSTPYTFPGGTSKIVNHNNARLAEVWLDQWKYFYYNINPGSINAINLKLLASLLSKKIIIRKTDASSTRLLLFSHLASIYFILFRVNLESGNFFLVTIFLLLLLA